MKKAWVLAVVASIYSSAAGAGVGINAGTQTAGGIFYGGGIGASFGDVDYIDLAPMVGIHLTPELSAGVSLLYRYVNDSRGSRNDYGSTLFARYHLLPSVFLEADYEYLDHEYFRADLSTARKQFSSFLAGGGITSSLGGNVSSYVSVLYNFSYDAADSPYTDPWTVRFGIGVGF